MCLVMALDWLVPLIRKLFVPAGCRCFAPCFHLDSASGAAVGAAPVAAARNGLAL